MASPPSTVARNRLWLRKLSQRRVRHIRARNNHRQLNTHPAGLELMLHRRRILTPLFLKRYY